MLRIHCSCPKHLQKQVLRIHCSCPKHLHKQVLRILCSYPKYLPKQMLRIRCSCPEHQHKQMLRIHCSCPKHLHNPYSTRSQRGRKWGRPAESIPTGPIATRHTNGDPSYLSLTIYWRVLSRVLTLFVCWSLPLSHWRALTVFDIDVELKLYLAYRAQLIIPKMI